VWPVFRLIIWESSDMDECSDSAEHSVLSECSDLGGWGTRPEAVRPSCCSNVMYDFLRTRLGWLARDAPRELPDVSFALAARRATFSSMMRRRFFSSSASH